MDIDGINVLDTTSNSNTETVSDEFKGYTTLIFNGRILHFRKWKVKDKIALDKSKSITDIKKALVYNCIYEQCVLDSDEYNYVLFKIRNETVHEPFEYDYACSNCGEYKPLVLNLEGMMSTVEGNFDKIEEYNIVLKYVDNMVLYDKLVSSEQNNFKQFINDFALHIKSYNGIEIKTEDDVNTFVDYISEMDADIANDLLDKWSDKRFKVIIESDIICDKCGNIDTCDFTNLPDFFPKSWNI